MVIDASAMLALLLGEPAADEVAAQLNDARGHLSMSTVNLAEVLIRLHDLRPAATAAALARLAATPIRFVPPTADHARIAAAARHRFPINLGDCFAYALAVAERDRILALDADFAKTDAEVVALRAAR